MIEDLKVDLIEFLSKNLPVSYSRMEADGQWFIKIDENGNLIKDGYAYDFLEDVTDWKDLPLSELAFLIENNFD